MSQLADIHINDVVECINPLDKVIALQKRFGDISSLCLDSGTLASYTKAERFAAALYKYPQYRDFDFKTAGVIAPTSKGLLDGDRMQEIFQL